MIPGPVIALLVAALLIFTDIAAIHAVSVRLRPAGQNGARS
jgi:hypothetical protein